MILALGIFLLILGGFMHTQNIKAMVPNFIAGAGGVILLIKIFAPG